jgi:DNA-binding SARP family transcriptional activator/WD40 repeat protein
MDWSAGLRFQVLGPLEVRDRDGVRPLGGVKPRLLLAALLVNVNTVVSSDRLIDILWGDTPPRGAPAALAKYVYRLRSVFGRADAGLLLTTPPGYLLSLAAEQVDASRFAASVLAAQQLLADSPERARAALEEALALWRGTPWAEFADQHWIRPEVARLEAMRATALEDRCEAILALGGSDELIPQLEAIVAEFPLRERPRALLMQALYFAGRQADALSAYRGYRRYLSEELGLEPSAQLRGLEDQILSQRLEFATRPRAQTAREHGWAPSAVGTLDGDRFVGRQTDLDWLEALFNRALPGSPAVIGLLGGPPGIGKTSLVRMFSRVAHARGAAVILARCDPALGAATAVLEALRVPRDRRQAHHPGWDDVLRLVDQALSTVDAPAILLVIDDLDAAPQPGGALLEHLAQSSYEAALCVVGTATDLTGLDGQIGERGTHTRILSGLDPRAVGELLRVVSGAATPDALAQSVLRETAGVPSSIVAVGRTLRDADAAHQADRALARADSVRDALSEVHDQVARGVLARRGLRERTGQAVPQRAGDGPAIAVCPYKGLAPFDSADAGYFCGRERLVAELLAKVGVEGFVGIVGASGSGKSSLAAAGLLPALAAGALPGSDRWSTLLLRPGADPVGALCAGLGRLAGEPAAELRRRLDQDSNELLTIAGKITDAGGRSPRRLVVVVDQFEELFAAGTTPDARTRFIDALMQAAADRDTPVAVALVLRADFYEACAQHEALARALTQSQVLVAAMIDAELRRAVAEPAARAGLTVEDGLADAICADAAGEPGALPLVSTALLETWVRRSNHTLTIAGYADAGGVRGAVARLADGVYQDADDAGRAIIRRIFLRLADPEGATDDVRRRVRRDEVAITDAEQQLLAQLVNRRLVTASEDTVEVAHEALLREWPRLRGWLAEDRDGRRQHRQLADAAIAWDAEGRDEAGLYRGIRLQAAREWAATHHGDANPLETQFLTASEAASEHTLRATRGTARRLRILAVGLAALLIIATTAGLIAARQRSAARHQALQAAISRLATLARTLPNDQRDLALLLGAEGYQLQPSDESIGGLQAAVVQTAPGLNRIIRYRSATLLPALDPTGRLLAVPGADGTVTITNVATGQVVRTLTYPRPRQFAAFSGDSKLVAAGGFDGNVVVWDARTGKQSGAPLKVRGAIVWPTFDPTDDARLYAVTDTRELTAWDRHDPAHPRQIRSPYGFGFQASGDASAMTVSPDGRLVAVGDLYGGTVNVLDARTGKPIHDLLGVPGVFGADGVTLPIASGHRITLYNAVTGRPESILNTPSDGLLPRLSGDGRRLAVAQSAGDVAVYDVRSGKIVGQRLKLHTNVAFPVGFLPDGRVVTSGTQEAGIWTLGQTLPPIGRPLPAPGDYDWPAFMPDQREVVTRGRDHGRLLAHDASTGANLGPLLGRRVGPGFAASPDGNLVVAPAKDHSGTAIWQTATGERLGVLSHVPDDAALAWSPTGQLVATGTPRSVQLWDVRDPAHPLRTAIVSGVRGLGIWMRPILTFSRDGSLLQKSAGDDNGMTVIDVKSRRILWSKILSYVSPSQAALSGSLAQTAFSPDGKTLAVDFGDLGEGLVTLYNARTGQPRATITTQSSGGVGYLHEGRWLVATGGDTKPGAQLYDTQTLQPIGVPFPIKHVPGDEYQAGTNYPLGNYGIGYPVAANSLGTLFAAGERNAPVLWDVDPNHWQTIACTIAGRNLSHTEWHTYLPNLAYQRTCRQWPAGN